MKRRELKEVHEKSVLGSFSKYYSNLGHQINILKRPDPPDVVVTINGQKTWIEITDAFFSKELAESVTSYAADDKPHKPVPKAQRVCIDPHGLFSSVLESVILQKYNKASICEVYKQYGTGILLVGIINPFSSAEKLIASEKARIISIISDKNQ